MKRICRENPWVNLNGVSSGGPLYLRVEFHKNKEENGNSGQLQDQWIITTILWSGNLKYDDSCKKMGSSCKKVGVSFFFVVGGVIKKAPEGGLKLWGVKMIAGIWGDFE